MNNLDKIESIIAKENTKCEGFDLICGELFDDICNLSEETKERIPEGCLVINSGDPILRVTPVVGKGYYDCCSNCGLTISLVLLK